MAIKEVMMFKSDHPKSKILYSTMEEAVRDEQYRKLIGMFSRLKVETVSQVVGSILDNKEKLLKILQN